MLAYACCDRNSNNITRYLLCHCLLSVYIVRFVRWYGFVSGAKCRNKNRKKTELLVALKFNVHFFSFRLKLLCRSFPLKNNPCGRIYRVLNKFMGHKLCNRFLLVASKNIYIEHGSNRWRNGKKNYSEKTHKRKQWSFIWFINVVTKSRRSFSFSCNNCCCCHFSSCKIHWNIQFIWLFIKFVIKRGHTRSTLRCGRNNCVAH